MTDEKRPDEKLTPEELEQQQGEELPPREAMSLIALEPQPGPIVSPPGETTDPPTA